MSKVVPSQAVTAINQLFPRLDDPDDRSHPTLEGLMSIMRLLEGIPNELLAVAPEHYRDLQLGLSAIEAKIKTAMPGNPVGRPRVGGVLAAKMIRDVLTLCPDEYPPNVAVGLLFIGDANIRDSIRRDIAAVERALVNAEWKAATVLGGATIEALLHWALDQPQHVNAITPAAQAAVAAGTLGRLPSADRNRWGLEEFIVVARALGIIEERTEIAANLARGFRNLIHPGAAVRTGQACNRATALSAAAALEHVIEDLS